MAAGATYEPIASQTLGSATASVTFSSIPQGYTDLVVVSNMAGTGVDATSIRFNGDTGNNYSYTRLYGSGSAAASTRESNISVLKTGLISTTSITSPDTIITHINNYSNSTTYKTAISRSAATSYVASFVGLWRSTSAITSLTLLIETGSPNIASGSTFTLYGIAAA